MGTKVWWQSKTLWVNVLTLIILVLSDLQGVVTHPDGIKAIAEGIIVLNILLRVITHTKLVWEEPRDESME